MLKIKAITGILLYLLLVLPPVRIGLESVMAGHMLVQIPSLVICGYLVGLAFSVKYESFLQKYNAGGVPGIILVISILLFWMLPRSLDAALNDWYFEIFKFISLPILAGIPLADSWKKMNEIGKGFVVLNAISMFGVLSWLYIASPFRLCNNYLQYQQTQLGKGFLILIAIFILPVLSKAFLGHEEISKTNTDS